MDGLIDAGRLSRVTYTYKYVMQCDKVIVLHSIITRLSFDYQEEDTREYQREEHYRGDSDARPADRGRMLLQMRRCHVVAAVVVRVVQVGKADAGLLRPAVRLHATALGHVSLPVPEVFHAAALEPLLGLVPGARHKLALAVQPNGGRHLLAHRVLHLLAEHVAQDAANQHRHEDDEDHDEVGEQQALDLTHRTVIAQDGRADRQERHYGEHINSARKQVRAQQIVGETVVHDYPHADAED